MTPIVISDLLIGFSYLAISAALLIFYLRVRSAVPLHWVALVFGAFILACGGTHFAHVFMALGSDFETPRLYIQAVTVFASLAAALILPPLLPRAVHLVEAAKLSEQRRVELEAASAELERLNRRLEATRDDFLSSAAHEFRTPLTAALLRTQLLQRRMNGQREVMVDRREIRSIEAALQTLREGLDQLDHRESAHGAGQQRDPLELVRAAVAELRLPNPPAVQGGRGLRIDGNPEAFVDVVQELVRNAAVYSENRPVSIEVARAAGEIAVTVTDAGIGIPPDEAGLVFRRYYRGSNVDDRRFPGLGLGLTLAHQRASDHGARLSIGPNPAGAGTRATLEWPAAAVTAGT